MKAQANIRLKFLSTKHRDVALKAMSPETRTSTDRSKVTIRKAKQSLVLIVETSDTIALRSALNTYLRWTNSILDIAQALDNLTLH